ncbi:hypothetical protein KIH86_23955 [Paenibacillus sp. HN-1]|uniref:hypothetical protein n=1 Tax=Paenibacillus TaxID=44249 RepID=UPI001CA9C8E5|nr:MULTISPECIES: hypothetical protein [Paenibacillus]MBY9081206.1 hypothetical protein [Paenibacillus sp. CGMCC 1.18879]MBY9087243.1 hypothetical protein [Paenibacillus sinensis]
MKKQLIIEIDYVDGSIDYQNIDHLTYSEALGMMEFVKLLITKDFLEEAKEV